MLLPLTNQSKVKAANKALDENQLGMLNHLITAVLKIKMILVEAHEIQVQCSFEKVAAKVPAARMMATASKKHHDGPPHHPGW